MQEYDFKYNSKEVAEACNYLIESFQAVGRSLKPVLLIFKDWYNSLPDSVKLELESDIEVDETGTYKKYKVKE